MSIRSTRISHASIVNVANEKSRKVVSVSTSMKDGHVSVYQNQNHNLHNYMMMMRMYLQQV